MMRLDRFLVAAGVGSRKEVKDLVKKGQIRVNDAVCRDADCKIDELTDVVTCNQKPLIYVRNHYYLLHKPAGVITATEDKSQKTVMDLLQGISLKDLAPVGRLDKDTEGLLLITDDGELSHRLLSSKYHVDKCYYIRSRSEVSQEQISLLETGIDIGDEKPTLPAKVSVTGSCELTLTICEGRYHQVKRMLQAIGNEVLYLKRISFGSLSLPIDLPCGSYRPLTDEEISSLKADARLLS